MDDRSTSAALSAGAVESPGVLPRAEQLAHQEVVFGFHFGPDELPEEPGIIGVRGPRQYHFTNLLAATTWSQTFTVYDPKARLISAAPFRDRVVHHALHAAIAPVFERAFTDDSYATRVGKGSHACLERFHEFLRESR